MGTRGVRPRTGPRRQVLPAQTQQAREPHHPGTDRLPGTERQPDDAQGEAGPHLRRGPSRSSRFPTDRASLQRPAPGRWGALLLHRRTVRRKAPSARRALPSTRSLRRRPHAPPPRPHRPCPGRAPCTRTKMRPRRDRGANCRDHPLLAVPGRDRERMGEHARPPADPSRSSPSRVSGTASTTSSPGLLAPSRRQRFHAPSTGSSTPLGRRRRRSHRGGAAFPWSCCATPARTGSWSMSTTGRN